MRRKVLKCAEILQETRSKPLSFQKIGSTENRTLMSDAVSLTLSTTPIFLFNLILY